MGIALVFALGGRPERHSAQSLGTDWFTPTGKTRGMRDDFVRPGPESQTQLWKPAPALKPKDAAQQRAWRLRGKSLIQPRVAAAAQTGAGPDTPRL